MRFSNSDCGTARVAVAACALLACSAALQRANAAPFDRPYFSPYGSGYGYRYYYEEPERPVRRASPPLVRHKAKEAERKEPIPHGPYHIIVSIARQRVTLFADGKPVLEGPVSTGVPGHSTPMGVFAVIGKDKWHRSNIYSAAPMPYMQRITWSGVALHAGVVPGHPASHGCIRLKEDFAIKLWNITKLGARVIVTRDETAPFEIVDARLPVPKKPEPVPVTPPPVTEPLAAATSADLLKTAAAGDGAKAADTPPALLKTEPVKPATLSVVDLPSKRKGPIQIFISRKESKLYARQGFAPLFSIPITIPEPDKPWGTHVFTLMEMKEDGQAARWSVVTIPSGYYRKGEDEDRRGRSKLSVREQERRAKLAADLAAAPSPSEALSRFEIPKDAAERIAASLDVNSALTVSDNALSDETGIETDFIVLTR